MQANSSKVTEDRFQNSSSRRARPYTKGRQVDQLAKAKIQSLIGSSPRRDLLIEYLHLIQDQYGYLSSQHLAALAEEMRLSQSEVYEVATFYAHFDIVHENEQPPPPLTIRVCDSISCQLANAEKLIHDLKTISMDEVRVLRAPCMGRCATAPVAEVGHNHVDHATVQSLVEAVEGKLIHPTIPEYIGFEEYCELGGYRLWKACRDGEHTHEQILNDLDESQLKGLGGAGFPTGRKWRIVRGYEAPRLMAVNIDEGEPGTFKDRYYLERDPHRFIEGMLIAAWLVGIEKSYLYVRDEYPAIITILKKEILKVQSAKLADHLEIEIRRGAGAYICGEESAMIESIEGKRGLPRNRPPYVAEVGLFGRPTLENNVETLHWIRDILEKGPKWFSNSGINGCFGLRSYSVSGRVKNPGVKMVSAGITIRDLIDNHCGGMLDGHKFKAYLPGGASGGILPSSIDDVPLDFGTLQDYGCFIGSAAIVVFSDQDNMKDVALNLMRFFRDESCGQCTPCRNGTEKAAVLMAKPEWEVELLEDLSVVMTEASICGLGQAAGNPINCVLKYFPEDL
ncbi:MAG: NAD(P)H-dependent oxidoreductase subunit E [Gammaproteobacteria bacterium]|nr:NAD(P)H-dependent oxidoreductase subunit E [Gammaproteobacteria bacterium]MCY4218470.1 NAD(P)H-dependent oxidoreductase subunit E [Gammaproteobacteria bacterium]MCY4275124.1 NAD(P)H-dependent oxidoreductase subunit E [Gammaproteobacteria bacterium]